MSWKTTSFSRNLWLYLVANAFWSFGLMTFFLVYNLYLLDLGHNEGLIGQVSAAMTAGSLTVTLPSSWFLNRFGSNRMIQASVICTAISLLSRSLVDSRWLLILLAFLNGAATGAWIVAAPPFLTQNTVPECRPRAFSLSYGTSIGMGALAGLAAGMIPSYLSFHLEEVKVLPELLLKRIILVTCSLIVLVPFFLLLFLQQKLEEGMSSASMIQPLSQLLSGIQSRRFILRLLVVLVLWSLFVGSFSPFFNVFFHKEFNQSLKGIGRIFSLSQFCQVMAVLSMPWLTARLGRVPAIFSMQFTAAIVLPVLLFTTNVHVAGLLYVTYLSFQVMTEPALENFIMDSVLPQERNLVSSLRYMILFLIQALSVWASGFAIVQFGYSSLLITLAVLGISASLTFYFCFRTNSGVICRSKS